MPAEGTVTYADKDHPFLNDTAFDVLDWGSASGKVNNKPFGFNIGYGFGDTSSATENIFPITNF